MHVAMVPRLSTSSRIDKIMTRTVSRLPQDPGSFLKKTCDEIQLLFHGPEPGA